jgi:hypothetical protein
MCIKDAHFIADYCKHHDQNMKPVAHSCNVNNVRNVLVPEKGVRLHFLTTLATISFSERTLLQSYCKHLSPDIFWAILCMHASFYQKLLSLLNVITYHGDG